MKSYNNTKQYINKNYDAVDNDTIILEWINKTNRINRLNDRYNDRKQMDYIIVQFWITDKYNGNIILDYR